MYFLNYLVKQCKMSLEFVSTLCITGWSIVSEFRSIRGFQDIEMWLPKLVVTDSLLI